MFLSGISGLLGLNAALMLRDRFTVTGCYHEHPVAIDGIQVWGIDLRRSGPIQALLEELRPAMILHAAGLVNVDACEQLPEEAQVLNVDVSRTIAGIASSLGSKLIHVSTDHLFDGTRSGMAERDPLSPVNVYGRTKAEAEGAVRQACPDALIVRTNFYGWGTPLKASFSDWILSGLEQQARLAMFTDVYFTPILIHDLVERMVELAGRGARGVYHLAGRERISKHAFALALAKVFGLSAACVEASALARHPRYARRPLDMSLSCAKATEVLGPMPGLRDGLHRLKRLGAGDWRVRLAQAVAGAPAGGVAR